MNAVFTQHLAAQLKILKNILSSGKVNTQIHEAISNSYKKKLK